MARKVREMSRPKLGPRDRVRMEVRLPPAVAESAYRCARDWDVSLSEAASRLIVSGYANRNSCTRDAGTVGCSCSVDSDFPHTPTDVTQGGCAAREA